MPAAAIFSRIVKDHKIRGNLMTLSIAITGKSGSGKTTVTKNFVKVLKEMYPEKSILLFDNDLSTELAHSYGMETLSTVSEAENTSTKQAFLQK